MVFVVVNCRMMQTYVFVTSLANQIVERYSLSGQKYVLLMYSKKTRMLSPKNVFVDEIASIRKCRIGVISIFVKHTYSVVRTEEHKF